MSVIEDFVDRYRREYDFYDQTARLVAQLLEARLQTAGVRAIVTFRAKAVGRLEPKVRDRAQRKAYATVEDVYADIPDLAGVRVALYFPAQREQVGLIIGDLFVVMHSKAFPAKSTAHYAKRFPGYFATHYRVRLQETSLPDSQKRYAQARVEVQVASVLMHAWAEVEHDLVYKPYQGVLSEDEYAILDELNGMVMTGEIALERLQRAGDVRVAVRGRTFANHYELAAYLLSSLHEFAGADFAPIAFTSAILQKLNEHRLVPGGDPLQAGLGRMDLLHDLLAKLGLANPEAVARYLTALHADLERRPIADQIIDQVLSEDPARYKLYENIRAAHPLPNVTSDASEPIAPDAHEAMGRFLAAWIELERLVRGLVPPSVQERGPVISTARVLGSNANIDSDTRSQYERLRRLRNQWIHGVEVPDSVELREAARQLDTIRRRLLEAGT
ncbi:MAG: hypothetical protein JW395_3130 [Nitrospira sp.]|nr:hypothetical protein [Nitrospira sp.]